MSDRSPSTQLPSGHTVEVQPIDWMDLERNQYRYDVIIGSDIVCNETDGEALAGAVAHYLAPQGRGYFMLPPSQIRFGVSAFLISLKTHGLAVSTQSVCK